MSLTNVRVALRIRPLSSRERLAGSTDCVSVVPGVPQIIAGPDRSFTFDAVFDSGAEQLAVFDELAVPLLDYFLDGYNCTVLAYGQTGSGKTFTMGTGLDGNLDELSQGIVPRAIDHILYRLRQLPSTDFWEMYVSFLEIYNEEIIDLLSPVIASGKRHTLSIREDAGGEIFLTGIKEEKVESTGEVFGLLHKGSLCRTTKSTDMNMVSSRSHAIFTVTLRQRRQSKVDGTIQNLTAKLHFVDLAGSERLKRTNAIGDRAKESISINSGLLALGNVISALGDESKHATHIPYRDSKLTRLLQDSLGGNSRTLMIACVSPSTDNFTETLNTLKYANRARNIKNRVAVNENPNGNAVFEIVQLKKQVAALKQELLQARTVKHVSSVCQDAAKSQNSRLARSDSSVEDSRIRQQLAEMTGKYEDLLREKVSIEAERDYLKSVTTQGTSPQGTQQIGIIRQHLMTINDLKKRLREAEKRPAGRTATQQSQSSPARRVSETPEWFQKTSELVDRARNELASQVAMINAMQSMNVGIEGPVDSAHGSREQLAAAVQTRVQAALAPILQDVGLKEDLVEQLKMSQVEFANMQQRYNERLKLLQDNATIIQKERDVALSRVGQQAPESNAQRISRLKYEDRIKRMGKEIIDLKDRLEQQTKLAASRLTSSDTQLRSLRQTVNTLKAEKIRLTGQLSDESTLARSRQTAAAADLHQELTETRSRERKAVDAAKKWRKAYDFQKGLLQRRVEQCLQAKGKIKVLLGVMRKNHIRMDSPVVDLNSPGWRNVLKTPSASALMMSQSAASMEDGVMPMTPINLNSRHDPAAMDVDSPPVADLSKRFSSSINPSGVSTPKSRLAYGWVPTEGGQPASVSPTRPKPRDFFAQIADAANLSLKVSSTNPYIDKKQK